MSTYNVGIIGCGNIFPMHAASVEQQQNARLVAVCDTKEERARAKAKQHNCAYYIDYNEMIAEGNVDVVHICTPHYLHAPMAIAAANHGKHVLTEKPMAITNENALAMIQAAQDNKVVLGVIFQNRYNAGSVLIKEALESGRLGKIIGGKLSVTWKRTDEYYSHSDWKGTWDQEGGGVIIDQAIHTIDLMHWFVNSDVDYVAATISNRTHELIQVEDAAEGIIKYKNGVIAAFYTINYYGYDAPVEIELHCENGIAKLIGETGIIKLNDGIEARAERNPNEFFNYGSLKQYWGVSHIKQITNYYQALALGAAPDITGEEALKTQKVVCAIYASGKSRQPVKI